jgi:hypothetical protein
LEAEIERLNKEHDAAYIEEARYAGIMADAEAKRAEAEARAISALAQIKARRTALELLTSNTLGLVEPQVETATRDQPDMERVEPKPAADEEDEPAPTRRARTRTLKPGENPVAALAQLHAEEEVEQVG